MQRPHPPLWMTSSRNLDHFRWIARRGLNLMTIPWTSPSLAETARLIGEYRAALHEGSDAQVLALFPVHVAETIADARQVEPHWTNMSRIASEARGTPLSHSSTFEQMAAEGRVFFGNPQMCREQVRKAVGLGIDQFALLFHFGGLAQQRTLTAMRLFMKEVVPGL
ncbi:MAG: LLM class flavin-dependent oxidoreductase [Chloroflexi bacterium]|nr:LLM class flavin-dependent oxidoreductase [Chloroflexota bacterium]